jgi:hypothetical protein
VDVEGGVSSGCELAVSSGGSPTKKEEIALAKRENSDMAVSSEEQT